MDFANIYLSNVICDSIHAKSEMLNVGTYFRTRVTIMIRGKK